jgi:hypothetical protein
MTFAPVQNKRPRAKVASRTAIDSWTYRVKGICELTKGAHCATRVIGMVISLASRVFTLPFIPRYDTSPHSLIRSRAEQLFN